MDKTIASLTNTQAEILDILAYESSSLLELAHIFLARVDWDTFLGSVHWLRDSGYIRLIGDSWHLTPWGDTLQLNLYHSGGVVAA